MQVFSAVSFGYALINAHKPKCICAYEKICMAGSNKNTCIWICANPLKFHYSITAKIVEHNFVKSLQFGSLL